MDFRKRHVLVGPVSLALLLGQTPRVRAFPTTDDAPPRATAVTPLVYVSEQPRTGGNPTINVYQAGVANPKVIGTIGKWSAMAVPTALATDPAGTLYVSVLLGKQLNHTAIYVFPNGAQTPAITYTYDNPTSGEQEGAGNFSGGSNVAVDTDGTIYTSGLNPLDNTNEILTFKPGQQLPVRILPSSAFGGVTPISFALDRKHNLYVSYLDPLTQRSGIIKFSRGQEFGVDLGIDVPPPAYVKLDQKGNYWLSFIGVLAGQLSYIIDVLPKGTIQPQRQLPFGGEFAFDPKYHFVYSLNYDTDIGIVFRNADGKQAWTITDGLGANNQPTGIAVNPAPPAAP